MAESLKKLRIFAASPSDVASEGAKLETVVESLKPMADYLGLTLEVVDWRAVVPDAGRPQQVIFDQLNPTSWDIFVGILWHRFGTPPGAKDKTGKEYFSGTEEEFKTAYELWKQHGKPRIVIYRCTRALPFDVDPDQLKRVRDFFKLIEDVKGDYQTLYQAFDTTESFEKLVLNNLQKLLVEYGEDSKTPITPEVKQVLAPKIPNNLPRRQAFFGRAKEMETVIRALSPADRTWGVLVDGIGGIGKSAIAIEAAYRSQEAGTFDAFVFVTAKTNILEPSGIKELKPPAQTLDEFLNETARILGQSGIAKLLSDEKRRALIDLLRSMRTLLIYDNLETLSKEEQEGIADFLRELPQGCKAIITSRRRGGEGGVWLRVEKLDWDAALGIIKNQMSLDERLAHKLNHAGETCWQELFDETNGSPLALVHTLGLMRVRTVLTFDGVLEMLRGNRDEDLQEFIFQEARKELTENDKAALGALSFFVPSAPFDAWMQVAKLSRNVLETAVDRLSALSLADVLAGDERYALHPLTRAFVRNNLFVDVNVVLEMGLLFARYWVDYTQRYGGDYGYKTFNQLDAEWTNIEATADWLWATANVQGELIEDKDAVRMFCNLTQALVKFAWFAGKWDDIVFLRTRSYEANEALQDWIQVGWSAYNVAIVYFNRACIDDAILWADRCSETWNRSNNKKHQMMAVQLHGLISEERDDLEKAESFYKEALTVFRDLNDESNIIGTLLRLASVARQRKDFKISVGYCNEALELSQKVGDKEFQSAIFCSLGSIALDRDHWKDARKWFELALPLAKEIAHLILIAEAQSGLASVYEADGREDLALPLAQEALKIYERLHIPNAEERKWVEMLEKRSEAKE